ncbi:barstar family protein [Streptomyces sp. NPDC013740]|uniref:barstar family protein n=1 Tax=Streptomyces sp. NPDC013740 TaxID=3364867 RepID=UPI0036FD0F17
MVIDVGSVRSERDLHGVLRRELGFPSFYGMNWAAFWDAITGLVEMPSELRFVHWAVLECRAPAAASARRRQLARCEESSAGIDIAFEE